MKRFAIIALLLLSGCCEKQRVEESYYPKNYHIEGSEISDHTWKCISDYILKINKHNPYASTSIELIPILEKPEVRKCMRYEE